MKQDLKLKLQAWLDGELPPAEAAALRALAAADPEAKRLLEELQAVKAALRQNERAASVPETREFYWSKIQQQIRREERVRRPVAAPWAARLRRWLAPMAGATALAAAFLAAVHHSPRPAGLNLVSVTAEGIEARTFHDQSSGMNIVFLQDTRGEEEPAGDQLQPAHTREDGSSFMTEFE
jgi:anti-sigma factor RsiW